jgi:hypothetical protein
MAKNKENLKDFFIDTYKYIPIIKNPPFRRVNFNVLLLLGLELL